MPDPVWSVVLPLYNGRRYMDESIKSVLCQTYDSFEFVVCDDGSTDGSLAAATAYAADPRVRVLANDRNRGLFPTLNRLVRESRGRRVRLWSQDDRMLPDCLATEDRFWDERPEVGLCYSAYDRMDETGRVCRPAPDDPTPEHVPGWLADQISFYYGCMAGNIATMSFPRDVYDAVGPFDERMIVSGDFEYFIRIAGRYDVGRQTVPVVAVRGHSNQFSRRAGSALRFMYENEPLYDELLSRLPPGLTASAGRYRVRYHYVKTFHFGMRAAARGQLAVAAEVVRFLARETNLAAVAFFWLASANVKLFPPGTTYSSPGGRSWDRISRDMSPSPKEPR